MPANKINQQKKERSVEKYIPPQYSIAMEYIFNPFYEFVAKFFPQWWSPNGITLFGITCTLVASILFFTDVLYQVTNDPVTGLPRTAAGFESLYDIRPTSLEAYGKQRLAAKLNSSFSLPSGPVKFAAPASTVHAASLPDNSFVFAGSSCWIRVVLIITGVLNCIYIIADNTDGKHARRYKKSSAIGEYLDHGLDMISALLSCFVVGAAAGERVSIGFVLQVGAGLMMIFSHFHNYDKNEFIWGDRLFSVDEAMVLIAVYPMIVGIFPSLQDVIIPGTDVRVVQAFVFVFVGAMAFNCGGFIRRNKNTLNFLLAMTVFSFAVMCGWSVFHKGGMSQAIHEEMTFFTKVLSPYLSWSGDSNVSMFNVTFPEQPAGTPAPSRAVRFLYTICLRMCPPYMLRVVGSRFLQLFTCYPALWSITMACAMSTIAHIPISGKCLKVKNLSYVPLAGVLLFLYVFGVSPIAGTMIAVLWHLGQILINCASLQARAAALKQQQ